MLESELVDLIHKVQHHKCKTQTLEVKTAAEGAPKIYDTLSSFSNQAEGGTILLGLDESSTYQVVGVYDEQDLPNKIREMGREMEPVVEPIITVHKTDDDKAVISVEIIPLDLSNHPCFKRTAGPLQGSYIRVGGSDKRMTNYEVYAAQAYGKRIQEDQRTFAGLDENALNSALVLDFIRKRTQGRPNIASEDNESTKELLGVTKNASPTLMALTMFGRFPQIQLPGLHVNAVRVSGTRMDDVTANETQFLASERLEGTLVEMLDASVAFVEKNMRTAIGVDSATGERFDIPEYPIEAVREILLNALVHRDYSTYTESRPIELHMFSDRLEVHSPGSLYGHLVVEDLGSAHPEKRNQAIMAALETMGYTENRYSGIPRIRCLMAEAGLPEPEFENRREQFTVRLFNDISSSRAADNNASATVEVHAVENPAQRKLLEFCAEPRSRSEIANFLHISSQGYAIIRYATPLVRSGHLQLTMPDKPRSPLQRYVTNPAALKADQ